MPWRPKDFDDFQNFRGFYLENRALVEGAHLKPLANPNLEKIGLGELRHKKIEFIPVCKALTANLSPFVHVLENGEGKFCHNSWLVK